MPSIKKNFAYQSLYQIVSIILPLATSPYLARILGAEKLGVYSYTYAIAFYFLMFAMLGIGNYGNKAIAAVRDDFERLNKTFSAILCLHLLFSILAIIAYYVFVFLFVEYERKCFFIQGLWVVSAFFDISWLFFGLEKFKITAIRSTIIKLLMTLLIFLVVKKGDDVWLYCLIMGAGTLGSQLVLWPLAKKNVRFVRVSWADIKPHISPLFVLFIPVIAISLYRYVDKVMLGVFSSKSEVGFFENAEKAVNIPVSIINSFGIVMLPRMSNIFAKESSQKGLEYINHSLEWIMCLTCAMAFGMSAVAKEFSIFFWGNDFERSGLLMEILCMSIIFMCFANVLRTQYLIPKGRNRCYVISVCFGALVNVVINLIAIPRYGAYGAVIGTICAELVVCVSQIIGVWRDLPILIYVKKTVFFLVFGVIMFSCIKLIGPITGNIIISLFVHFLVGVMVYTLLCTVYFLFTKNMLFLKVLSSLRKKISHD